MLCAFKNLFAPKALLQMMIFALLLFGAATVYTHGQVLYEGAMQSFAEASDFGLTDTTETKLDPGGASNLVSDSVESPAEGIASILNTVINFLLAITAVIAVVLITWYGFRTVFFAASPEKAAAIKDVILWVVLGLLVLLVVKPVVGILWGIEGGSDFDTSTSLEEFVTTPVANDILNPSGTVATSFQTKLFEWVRFFEQIIAIFAVLIIIFAGARMVVSGGNDNARTQAMETIMYVVIGLLVMVFANVIVAAFYTSGTDVTNTANALPGANGLGTDMTTIMGEIIGLTNFVLQILAVVAVSFIIYGGFKYLTGNSDEGKKTVINAVIGLVIIIASYSIVEFVLPSA